MVTAFWVMLFVTIIAVAVCLQLLNLPRPTSVRKARAQGYADGKEDARKEFNAMMVPDPELDVSTPESDPTVWVYDNGLPEQLTVAEYNRRYPKPEEK